MYQLKIISITFLKQSMAQSSTLPIEQKEPVAVGSIFDLDSYTYENGHIKVTFTRDTFNGFKTWYVFAEHAQILQDGQPLNRMILTDADYQQAADILGVPSAAIKAVVAVETDGSGFFDNEHPKILFEAAWFSDYTNGQYDRDYPSISSAGWNRDLYVGGIGEYDRLDLAKSLDHDAALKSASWGLGQIMGGNYAQCGYKNVEDFVADMYESEGEQLVAMIKFILFNNLDIPLKDLNWAGFAQGYNGSGYRQNDYDAKLAEAYQSFLGVA